MFFILIFRCLSFVYYLLRFNISHEIKTLITRALKGSKGRQRKSAQTPKVIFVVASHHPATAFKLHFCSYKHVFQRFTSFVGYDQRSFKICFQERLIFYKAPTCHQCLAF